MAHKPLELCMDFVPLLAFASAAFDAMFDADIVLGPRSQPRRELPHWTRWQGHVGHPQAGRGAAPLAADEPQVGLELCMDFVPLLAFASAAYDASHLCRSLLNSLEGNYLQAEGCKAIVAVLDKTQITSLKCASLTPPSA